MPGGKGELVYSSSPDEQTGFWPDVDPYEVDFPAADSEVVMSLIRFFQPAFVTTGQPVKVGNARIRRHELWQHFLVVGSDGSFSALDYDNGFDYNHLRQVPYNHASVQDILALEPHPQKPPFLVMDSQNRDLAGLTFAAIVCSSLIYAPRWRR